jgi:hypothetical protein
MRSSDCVRLTTCGHCFCEDCLKGWITAESSASSAGQVRCPHTTTCKGLLSQRELKHLSGDETFQKMDRRALELTVATDSSLHLCTSPNCSYIVSWRSAAEDGVPHSICPLCSVERCLACRASPYHNGLTCDQHRAQQEQIQQQRVATVSLGDTATMTAEEEEQLSMQTLRTIGTRQCNRCKEGVLKQTGCNKMQCRCGYRFCYECGIEDATCDCTPKNHGFIDNLSGRGDFSNLKYDADHSKRATRPRAELVGERKRNTNTAAAAIESRSFSLSVFQEQWRRRQNGKRQEEDGDGEDFKT